MRRADTIVIGVSEFGGGRVLKALNAPYLIYLMLAWDSDNP